MLFWEALNASTKPQCVDPPDGHALTFRTRRLPYDKRCAALTKSGVRCRGRIRNGTDFCPFHDPELTAERRRRIAAKGGRHHRRLSRLPDGYLRRLKSRAAIGEAMDRLYREVRLGLISAEMGSVLFRILTRLLDSDLITSGPCPERSKAARIRPKLGELLTLQERAAWRQAIDNAAAPRPRAKPAQDLRPPFERAATKQNAIHQTKNGTVKRPLQAAS